MQARRFSNQRIVQLDTDARVGGGGEGIIYQVVSDSTLVAKVYHAPTDVHASKLAVMLAIPPHDPTVRQGHRSIAWPVDLLIDPSNRVIGYLMPRATGVVPLYKGYNPGDRRKWCSGFNYLYLHRTAANLASAIAAVHERDYVIGDVNESNILLDVKTLVTLVDTDSFQVRDPGSGAVYRCMVGKPEFTPPELVGKNLGTVDRSVEHDRFGLAVLIFYLLMEGTHPFDGKFEGGGDPPAYEERISSGHFPHGTRSTPYKPRPTAPPFEILHPDLRDLFRRCFEGGHPAPSARPTAQQWHETLLRTLRDLQNCHQDSGHHYGKHLNACPWCERANRYRIDPFTGKSTGPPLVKQRTSAQQPPAASPTANVLPTPTQTHPTPRLTSPARTGTGVGTPVTPGAAGRAVRRSGLSRRGFAALVGLLILAGFGGYSTLYNNHKLATTKPLPLKIAGNSAVNPQDGAELVLIPAGSFPMGDNDISDNPRHTVKLSGYWIYKNLVTVGQYKKYVAAMKAAGKAVEMPSAPDFDKDWSQDDHPIVNVSWDDAKAYCDWAGVRLPTEAEWEKAARGTKGRKYPWGDDWDASRSANSVGQSRSGTAPVGNYPSGASPYGVSDMAGNVWQWCSDFYDADYWKNAYGANPKGPASGDFRVLRGGSWDVTDPAGFRSAFRFRYAPDFRGDDFGFRGASGL